MQFVLIFLTYLKTATTAGSVVKPILALFRSSRILFASIHRPSIICIDPAIKPSAAKVTYSTRTVDVLGLRFTAGLR